MLPSSGICHIIGMDTFHATVDDGETCTCSRGSVRFDAESALREALRAAIVVAIDRHTSGVDTHVFMVELRATGSGELSRYNVSFFVEAES